jgi:hypothetical protein
MMVRAWVGKNGARREEGEGSQTLHQIFIARPDNHPYVVVEEVRYPRNLFVAYDLYDATVQLEPLDVLAGWRKEFATLDAAVMAVMLTYKYKGAGE